MTPFTMHWYPSEQFPEGIDATTPEEMRDIMLKHGYPDFIWLRNLDGSLNCCLQLDLYTASAISKRMIELRKSGRLKDA